MVVKKGRKKEGKKRARKYEHFKSKKAYDKYEAYIHMNHIPHKHRSVVIINGKKHKVKK